MKNEVFFQEIEEKHGIVLNEKQREAVEHTQGQLLLLAVPGSGKTTTMIVHILRLIEVENMNPNRILAITFSKESAIDMQKRYDSLNHNGIGSPHFSTIHSLAFQISAFWFKSKNIPFEVLPEWKTKDMIERILEKTINMSGMESDEREEVVDETLLGITLIVNGMLTLEDIQALDLDKITPAQLMTVMQLYDQQKRENSPFLIDYDDMLRIAYHQLRNDPEILQLFSGKYDYILTDESQDTSVLQHAIIDLLVSAHGNLFMVGDDDQSIYGWRGVSKDSLLSFNQKYPHATVLFMEQNYRSSQKIVTLANDFIKMNEERYPKDMFTRNKIDSEIKMIHSSSLIDQYKHIVEDLKKHKEHNDAAILYRSNGRELPLIHLLEKNGVPYYQKKVQKKIFQNYMFQDLKTILLLAEEPTLKHWGDFKKIKGGLNLFLSAAQKRQIDPIAKESPEQNLFDTLEAELNVADWQIEKYREVEHYLNLLLKKKTLFEKLEYIVDGDIEYRQSLMKFMEFINKNPDFDLAILESVLDIAADYQTMDELDHYLEYLYEKAIDSEQHRHVGVNILTLHSSKGLEFKHVYLIIPTGISMTEKVKDNQLAIMEEETRLHYVGMTRAKAYLNLYTIRDEEIVSRDLHRIKKILVEENRKAAQTASVRPKEKDKASIDILPYSQYFDVSNIPPRQETVQRKAPKKRKQKKSHIVNLPKLEDISKGDYIKHRSFGEGEVLSISNSSLSIQFKRHSIKEFDYHTLIKNKIIVGYKKIT